MMKIAQYLSELLFQRDSVILPGFGEFRTTEKPAEKTPSGKITPPAKHISFNSSVKANDYVLAKYIAEREQLSILQGNDKLKAFADQLQSSLEKDRKLVLPALGSFSYDENNILIFDPDYDINYKTASFGLTPTYHDQPDKTVDPELSEEAKKTVKPEKTKKAAKRVKDKKQETVEEPIVSKEEHTTAEPAIPVTPPPIEKSERKKRRAPVWLIIILLILIAAAALAYLNQDLVKTYYTKLTEQIFLVKEKHEHPAESQELLDETIGIEAITDEQADESDSLAIADTVVTGKESSDAEMLRPPEPSAHKDPAIAGSKGSFAIIAGCFGENANAERMAAQLRSGGFPNASIEGQTRTGLYRVAAGTFPTESEAQAELVKARKENKLTNAWVTKL